MGIYKLSLSGVWKKNNLLLEEKIQKNIHLISGLLKVKDTQIVFNSYLGFYLRRSDIIWLKFTG